VGEETVYTKHQKLPQTSKHYKQSSLHSSVLVIVGVPFGVSASVASSLCGVLGFRGFILVKKYIVIKKTTPRAGINSNPEKGKKCDLAVKC